MCSSSYKSFNILFLQILVVSVLILSFWSLKDERKNLEQQLRLQAFVISENNERYHNSHSILSTIGFIVNRQQPIHYKSKTLDRKLTESINNNQLIKETLGIQGRINVIIENIQDRKYFSNRLSFLNILEKHNLEKTYTHTLDHSLTNPIPTGINNKYTTHTYTRTHIPHELDWIFLFEDDIKLHDSFVNDPKQAMNTILIGSVLYTIYT